MILALVVVGAVLLVLVVVFLAIHHIQPERLSLGVRTSKVVIGLEVERPSYLKAPPQGPERPPLPPGT